MRQVIPYRGIDNLFSTLVFNTQPSSNTYADAAGKQGQVRAALNKAYYGKESQSANSFPVGSYGKDTLIGPRANIDILFELPVDVFHRYSNSTGNIQSRLLHEVRDQLSERFPLTTIKANGQVIVVPFEKYAIEVLPTFKLTSGHYWHPDANDGGAWRATDPLAERQQLVQSDAATGRKTTHLIKMAKAWKTVKRVDIKSFVLELIAIRFLATWGYNRNRSGSLTGYAVYDFMMRDFFSFLLSQSDRSIWFADTSTVVDIGSAWEDQARAAAATAQRATEIGAEDKIDQAREEWRKIFSWYL